MVEQPFLQAIFRGSIFVYGEKIFAVIFGFLTTLYLVKSLTVADFGLFNFLLAFISVAEVIALSVLPSIILRYIPQYQRQKRYSLQRKILITALLLRFAIGLGFVMVSFVASELLVSVFRLSPLFYTLFPLLSLIILFVLESKIVGDALLPALFKNTYWSVARISYVVLKFFLFLFVLKEGYGLVGVVGAWVLSEIFVFFLFFGKVWRDVFILRVRNEEQQDAIPWKRLYAFGFPLWFQNIFYLLRDKALDVFLIAFYLGQGAVGLYSFAFGIPLLITTVAPGVVLRQILTPLFVHRSNQMTDMKEDVNYFFQFLSKVTFFCMVPILLLLTSLSSQLIEYVFREEYTSVSNLFVLSSVFLLISQFNVLYIPILYAFEKTKLFLWVPLLSLYNLAADILLIPAFGVAGAIIATGSTGIFLVFFYHIALKREGIRLAYPWKSFVRFSFNIAPIYVASFLVRGFLTNIFLVVGFLACATLAYLFFSYLNKGFSDQDRKLIDGMIGKKIWAF